QSLVAQTVVFHEPLNGVGSSRSLHVLSNNASRPRDFLRGGLRHSCLSENCISFGTQTMRHGQGFHHLLRRNVKLLSSRRSPNLFQKRSNRFPIASLEVSAQDGANAGSLAMKACFAG